MSADKTVLMVSMDVRGARRELALDLLLSGTGIVMMGRSLALRPSRDHIRCEVTLQRSLTRTIEGFQAAIADGVARLTKSSLAEIAHLRRLEWVVVDDAGPGTIQLWPPT